MHKTTVGRTEYVGTEMQIRPYWWPYWWLYWWSQQTEDVTFISAGNRWNAVCVQPVSQTFNHNSLASSVDSNLEGDDLVLPSCVWSLSQRDLSSETWGYSGTGEERDSVESSGWEKDEHVGQVKPACGQWLVLCLASERTADSWEWYPVQPGWYTYWRYWLHTG